jgi:hypothetical protein
MSSDSTVAIPTTWRAARVWFYARHGLLMSATLVRLEPHPDLDVRPPIIVVGFVLAMLPIYLLVQRLFRSLVRSRPDGPIVRAVRRRHHRART